jgi:predicted ArsR family transcriptional regulator
MSERMPRTAKVSDERIISALADSTDPVRTVPNMAQEVDLGRDGLRRRLNKLEKRGKVKSKTVGANAVVWWLPD